MTDFGQQTQCWLQPGNGLPFMLRASASGAAVLGSAFVLANKGLE